MIHKVGGKGGEHEVNGSEEPLKTPQQLPFCAFQHFPPLTSAKQQEEGTTGCRQCCSSGTDGTDSNCSQQPNTLAYTQRQYSVEISLAQNQLEVCDYTRHFIVLALMQMQQLR